MFKLIKIFVVLFLSWFGIVYTVKLLSKDAYQRRYNDVQMAQVWIKEHKELKATMRILPDGSVKIIPKKGRTLWLKDGVITTYKR